jgi:hypothetical protein
MGADIGTTFTRLPITASLVVAAFLLALYVRRRLDAWFVEIAADRPTIIGPTKVRVSDGVVLPAASPVATTGLLVAQIMLSVPRDRVLVVQPEADQGRTASFSTSIMIQS